MIKRVIEINDIGVSYWDSQEDDASARGDRRRATVLCCHGNSSAGDSFHKLAKHIGRRARVLALDFYGHGSTPIAAAARCGVNGYAALIAAFTARLRLDSYVLVGHSLGGHAVLESLPTLDGGVRGLVCLSAPPFNRQTVETSFRDPTEGLVFRDALLPAELARVAAAFASADNLTAEEQREVLWRVEAASGTVRACIGLALVQGAFADEVDLCRNARVPLTFVQGKEDPFIRIDCYGSLPLRSERDRVVLLDRVGHSPHLEAVEAVAVVIDRHLDACTP